MDFVLQSIRYFQRQDYPARELIILDDGTQECLSPISNDNRIRLVPMQPGATIGAKRNHGCLLARGAIIAQWDDDDWYGPSRLRAQVTPLLENAADLTAFSDCTFLELANWTFWDCGSKLFKRMFVGNVHGGTLVFKRSLFEQGLRYPEQSFSEDAYFLYQCNRKAARVGGVPSAGNFIYVRHPNSTWRFECGTHVDPREWHRISEPELPPQDLRFLKSYVAGF
jgi:glycosyltransferase involved in cell wall biosynthesis